MGHLVASGTSSQENQAAGIPVRRPEDVAEPRGRDVCWGVGIPQGILHGATTWYPMNNARPGAGRRYHPHICGTRLQTMSEDVGRVTVGSQLLLALSELKSCTHVSVHTLEGAGRRLKWVGAAKPCPWLPTRGCHHHSCLCTHLVVVVPSAHTEFVCLRIRFACATPST